MRRATLAVITCLAIAGAAMGATPPPPQKKAVTPQKKAAATTVAKKTSPPPAATRSAARTPPKTTPTKPVTTRRYYARQQSVRRTYPTRPAVPPSSDRFREIQDALSAKGYLNTPSSGVWDKASMDAMQRFQQDQKLDATGRLTARSIVALGLGPKAASLSGETSPLQ